MPYTQKSPFYYRNIALQSRALLLIPQFTPEYSICRLSIMALSKESAY